MKLRNLVVAALVAAPSLAQTCAHIGNAPPGTDLGLTDDSTRIIGLPFPFQFDNAVHNVISVSSNGFVWFGINTSSDFTDSEAELLAQGPRIAVCWDDWNPSSSSLPPGGGVFYNETATTAHVIWKDVPRFGSSTLFANMELVLSVTGQIDIHFLPTHSTPSSSSIVGVSAGNNAAANAVDLSVLPTSFNPVIPNATGYELFASNVFDLAGTTTTLTPTTPTDYFVSVTTPGTCPATPGPNLPTYNNSTASSYGGGCPAPTSGTWYEEFPSTTFDLSNTSWRFTAASGNIYVATTGSGFDTGYSAADALVQGDDTQVNVSLTAMGGFPFMGGTLTAVDVCSNGFLWMTPNTSNDYSPSAAEFASLNPRLAPCWGDWNFNQGGTGLGGTFYWTATATHCMATWENVAAFGRTGTQNTFQCKLYPNGDIEYSYLTVLNNSTTASGVALVGLSGGGSTPMAPVDISAGTSPLVDITPATAAPMAHTTTLPDLGSNYDMTTSSVPTGALFGATLVGFAQTNIDLGPLGAPGCFQYVGQVAVFLNVLSGATTFTNTLPIPLDLSFHGIPLTSQGAAYVPGLNALGAASSNGRLGVIGL